MNPARRSGLWVKRRINFSQEFVIGGYVPSHLGLDSIVIGFYRDNQLRYTARVRAGFVRLTRRQVFELIKRLRTGKCPFTADAKLIADCATTSAFRGRTPRDSSKARTTSSWGGTQRLGYRGETQV
jgi:ATP-dependent DNA ligase